MAWVPDRPHPAPAANKNCFSRESGRPVPVELLQARFGAGSEAEGFSEHEVKDHHRRGDEQRHGEVMRTPAAKRRREGDQHEQGGKDTDRIETGALPVVAAQMQPHPELVVCPYVTKFVAEDFVCDFEIEAI